ncbi:hypothetical protein BDW60DRAFT_178069 [Aspergillus nidulans var. acristatus]
MILVYATSACCPAGSSRQPCRRASPFSFGVDPARRLSFWLNASRWRGRQSRIAGRPVSCVSLSLKFPGPWSIRSLADHIPLHEGRKLKPSMRRPGIFPALYQAKL